MQRKQNHRVKYRSEDGCEQLLQSTVYIVNLRIHGTISTSKLIFDSRDRQENICSQPSKLGLVMLNTALRSFRVCLEMLLLNCKIAA